MRRRRRADEDPPAPPPGSARAAAIRLLGRRDYTRAELRHKLVERGHPEDEVDDTLARLADERWLDDRRVAQAHVRTSARIKVRGRHRILRELQARGVDPGLAHEAAAAVSPDDELAAIAQILARKHVSERPSPAEHRRIFAHLLRRGFSADAITKALRSR
jgi:regulatory protein